MSETTELWELSQERFQTLQREYLEILDQVDVKDDLIRRLRLRNVTQLGVIDRQAQAIAMVLELVYDKHLVRTEEIMRILEAVSR